jgi:hypothetical protein
MSIPKISFFVPDEFPKLKSMALSIDDSIVSEVSMGVFSATFLYGVEAFPSLLFHAIHIQFPSLIGNINHLTPFADLIPLFSLSISLASLLVSFSNNSSDSEVYFRLIQIAAVVATLGELTLSIYLAPCLAVQLTVRGIVLFSGIVGNARNIYQGGCKIHEGLSGSNLKTSEKVSRVVSGLISIGLGTFGSITTLQTATKLFRGLQVYQTLDKTQQAFALKHFALESLGEIKPERAVIINGFSSEWAEPENYYFDNTPDPSAYVVYQNYTTRTYEVTSSEELSRVLDRATKELGGKLDLVYFGGHANNKYMKLNADYDFTANLIETEALNKNISTAASVILEGCETARADRRSNSLTKLLSKRLPNTLVTGFSELLYPSYSWSWFDGKLGISAWSPYSKDSIVRTFLNGKLVA